MRSGLNLSTEWTHGECVDRGGIALDRNNGRAEVGLQLSSRIGVAGNGDDEVLGVLSELLDPLEL